MPAHPCTKCSAHSLGRLSGCRHASPAVPVCKQGVWCGRTSRGGGGGGGGDGPGSSAVPRHTASAAAPAGPSCTTRPRLRLAHAPAPAAPARHPAHRPATVSHTPCQFASIVSSLMEQQRACEARHQHADMRPRLSPRGGGALGSQPRSAAPWSSRGPRRGACPRDAGRCPCCTAPARARLRCRQPRPRPAASSPACPPAAGCPSSPPAPLSATSPTPQDGTGAHTQVALGTQAALIVCVACRRKAHLGCDEGPEPAGS